MLTLYDRAAGIVCLESDLFQHEAELPQRLGSMLTSRLTWQWSSTRRYPAHPLYAGLNLPAQRDWTRVTAVNLDLLAADLVEQDLNEDRRQVLLVGADRDLLGALSDTQASRRVLTDFVAEQPPVRMVAVQPGDTGSCLVFLPHHPLASARDLLDSWGIAADAAQQRRPYSRLRLAQFEVLFGL